MSKKKQKKGRGHQRRVGEDPNELQQTRKYKKFDPAARNLLWLDLISLAICQILVSKELIGDTAANVITVVGLILLLVALWLQFRPKHGGPKTPHL